MVLFIFQDGSIEGSLFPLLWGQGNLTAEPPGEEDKLGTGLDLWALTLCHTSQQAYETGRSAPVGGLLEPKATLLHLPL